MSKTIEKIITYFFIVLFVYATNCVTYVFAEEVVVVEEEVLEHSIKLSSKEIYTLDSFNYMCNPSDEIYFLHNKKHLINKSLLLPINPLLEKDLMPPEC